MKIFVKGQEINLSQNSFLASGGEGSVYVVGNTAYKTYHEPKKMMPIGKINELALITDPNVITPQDIILDKSGKQLGYTMRYVSDTYALCQLFTKAFKERNGLDHSKILELVKDLQKHIKAIHDSGTLVVDLNELNVLVNNGFKETYLIDCDSYQTKNYKATAIMDSIRDRHSKGYSELTDWFSFAILAFQMFISIHPYKGKHQTLKSLDDRMKANVSVLNKDVSVPSVCYPISTIPKKYLDWFTLLFERGDRLSPPSDAVSTAIAHQVIRDIFAANNFNIVKICDLESSVIKAYSFNNNNYLLTKKGFIYNKTLYAASTSSELVFSPVRHTPIVASLEGGMLKLRNLLNKTEYSSNIAAKEMSSYDNRIYVKNSFGQVFEVIPKEIGENILPVSKPVAQAHPNASKMYNGCVVQNLLDGCYINIFPKEGANYYIRVKELDYKKVIDAKYYGNVLMLIVAENGKYNKIILKFNDDYSQYLFRKIDDVDIDINFTVLDNGVCIHIPSEGVVEIFLNKYTSSDVNVIHDPTLVGDLRLYSVGARTYFYQDASVFSISKK